MYRRPWSALVWALVVSGLIMAVISSGLRAYPAQRAFILLGGNVSEGGYIQGLTYLAFFWALFEILQCFYFIAREQRALMGSELSSNQRHLFLAKDLHELYLKITEREKKGQNPSLVSNLIKKVCQKFRSTQSIPEIFEIITIQTDINKDRSESEQSLIRYLTWAIPSIGFIGTVIGISGALRVANSGDMDLIGQTLSVAFDTTVVALVLSLIIMYFFHQLQQKIDDLHAQIKEYLVENLVNRIEI